jgi:hypothetical protein
MSEWQAMLLSAAIEGPVAWGMVRRTRWPCRGALHAGLASMVATAVTHPQLWSAAIWAYGHYPFWACLLVLETLVVGVEGVLIAWMARLSLGHAMIVSLVANSTSCLLGLLV